MKKNTVVVIGAGNIAQMFDDVEGDAVLTHIKGYKQHPAFDVVGVCDARLDLAAAAAERWLIPHFAATLGELAYLKPNVVSICTPDHTHEAYLRECLAVLNPAPNLVFCEKPLANNLEAAQSLVTEYEQRGILLAVNYSRRWLTEFLELQEIIQNGGFGSVISARIKYYKGFIHNGSHLIDLLQMLVPSELVGGVILSSVNDYTPDDSTLSLSCLMKPTEQKMTNDVTVMIEGYDSRIVTPIELEIICEQAQILLTERDGTYVSIGQRRENSRYPGFFEFSDVQTRLVDASQAMIRAIAALAEALENGSSLSSTGATALTTLNLCTQMRSLPMVQSSIFHYS